MVRGRTKEFFESDVAHSLGATVGVVQGDVRAQPPALGVVKGDQSRWRVLDDNFKRARSADV